MVSTPYKPLSASKLTNLTTSAIFLCLACVRSLSPPSHSNNRPSFTFNKSGKRDAEEQRILARHLEEKADREEAREAAYASRERVEQGFREAEKSSRSKFGFNRNGNNNEAEPSAAPKTGRAKWEQGGRYQFEASNSDDELEAELDDNLDEIAGLTSRLKILATTAGKEIDAQNKHLDKVSGKVDNLDDKILMNTQYLKRSKSFFISWTLLLPLPPLISLPYIGNYGSRFHYLSLLLSLLIL